MPSLRRRPPGSRRAIRHARERSSSCLSMSYGDVVEYGGETRADEHPSAGGVLAGDRQRDGAARVVPRDVGDGVVGGEGEVAPPCRAFAGGHLVAGEPFVTLVNDHLLASQCP